MIAPFPYFGGKRDTAPDVWRRLGRPKQYIEPFCGSAAMLLAAPSPASLEVVCDTNGFIANFWRSVVYQPAEVARWADYPVSHIDLGARHRWLMDQRERITTTAATTRRSSSTRRTTTSKGSTTPRQWRKRLPRGAERTGASASRSAAIAADYDLPGWTMIEWERRRLTYASDKTKAEEAIWFSPACPDPLAQGSLLPMMDAGA